MTKCNHSIDKLYIRYCELCSEDEIWCSCGVLGLLFDYETLVDWYYDPENKDSPRQREWLE